MAKSVKKPVSVLKSKLTEVPKKGGVLKEVVVRATRLGKNPTTVRMYPKGEVAKSKIDSISKANPALAKKIGNPVQRTKYERPQYGSASSDLIKQAIKKK